MTWGAADSLANALLFEGYLLYPYHGSALKNRYRWQFGVVAPPGRGAGGGARNEGSPGNEPTAMQTECLVEAGPGAVLDLKIRFLHVEARSVERLARAPDEWEAVGKLSVDGRQLVSFDEAHPREITMAGLKLGASVARFVHPFEVEGGNAVEVVFDRAGEPRGRVVRERAPISFVVRVKVEPLDDLRRIRVRIENVTESVRTADVPPDFGPATAAGSRPATLRRSLIATHTLLSISGGSFVSLLDPPPEAAARAADCENVGTWPVLIGRPPDRSRMLSAPIVLYDHPSVAPESPGDLFDATEIDEMLTLRLLTLSDEERSAALATDPRSRRVIERAATLAPGAVGRLHGTIRGMEGEAAAATGRSAWEELLNPTGGAGDEVLEIDGRRITQGSRVRIRPGGRRADAMDLFLAGGLATVAAVYRDLEDRVHIAVTIDTAAADDLHESTGRFFYFGEDEIEPLEDGAPSPPARGVEPHAVLVAGIGNMFLGDDGFGPAVIQRLAGREFPSRAKVKDFGIRGVHLAHEMLGASPGSAAYETTIMIDAVARGGTPGTLYLLEPDSNTATASLPDAHALSVEAVLGFLRDMGGTPGRVLIVGCEAASTEPGIGLSEPVSAAVDDAADMVMRLLAARER